MDDNQNLSNTGGDSLENVETTPQNSAPSIGADGGETLDSTASQAGGVPDDSSHSKPKRSLSQRVQALTSKVNIYLLLFVLVILLAAIAAFASYQASKNAANNSNIDGQTLSAEDLQNLKNNDTQVGDAKQTLTIASNAIFNGRVLVRDSLDVAGTIRVGGALSLPGITVSGTSAFENVQIGNNLSIAGNAAVQGTLTVQKNLTVGGGATFAGTISAPALAIDQLILNQDLQLNRHISAGGGRPTAVSYGAMGSAGQVSVNGSDTAGNIQLHFGNGSYADKVAKVTFAAHFNQTPTIIITPVGSNCSNLNYYIYSKTTSSFEIGVGVAGHGDCSFDYIAFD